MRGATVLERIVASWTSLLEHVGTLNRSSITRIGRTDTDAFPL